MSDAINDILNQYGIDTRPLSESYIAIDPQDDEKWTEDHTNQIDRWCQYFREALLAEHKVKEAFEGVRRLVSRSLLETKIVGKTAVELVENIGQERLFPMVRIQAFFGLIELAYQNDLLGSIPPDTLEAALNFVFSREDDLEKRFGLYEGLYLLTEGTRLQEVLQDHVSSEITEVIMNTGGNSEADKIVLPVISSAVSYLGKNSQSRLAGSIAKGIMHTINFGLDDENEGWHASRIVEAMEAVPALRHEVLYHQGTAARLKDAIQTGKISPEETEEMLQQLQKDDVIWILYKSVLEGSNPVREFPDGYRKASAPALPRVVPE